jgi:hypothetical protein
MSPITGSACICRAFTGCGRVAAIRWRLPIFAAFAAGFAAKPSASRIGLEEGMGSYFVLPGRSIKRGRVADGEKNRG